VPKIAMAQGSAGLGWRRGGDSTTRAAGGIWSDWLSCTCYPITLICICLNPCNAALLERFIHNASQF
jgi:hypothetical protein